jgi:hypothetical protein
VAIATDIHETAIAGAGLRQLAQLAAARGSDREAAHLLRRADELAGLEQR